MAIFRLNLLIHLLILLHSLRYKILSNSTSLEGWSNADWAGDKATRKSHTGWMVRFGGSLVSWLSKAQGCLSQSTMEAEFVAVTALSKEVLWWRNLWQDLSIS
jgi:hypothetical protein